MARWRRPLVTLGCLMIFLSGSIGLAETGAWDTMRRSAVAKLFADLPRPHVATPSPTPARPTASPAAASTPPPTSMAPAESGRQGQLAQYAAQVLDLTNAERARAGCGALHPDSRLAAAAQGHSVDMAKRNYFSHDTPEGVSPWDRIKAAGYANPGAENIAYGYRTPADVMTGWMNSPGHRANILNCQLHALGVGVADSPRGPYWTQDFGYT
jgi:uncharacterized protein YkwD